LNRGIADVMTAVRAINSFFEIKQPWTLAKQGNQQEVEKTLVTAAESLRVCAALLYPVMPRKMGELRKLFGLGEPDLEQLRVFGAIKAGTAVPKTDPLFPRVELSKVEQASLPAQKGQAGKPAPQEKKQKPVKKEKPEGVITYDDVMNVKLRTAKILEAEKVEGADKLLKLQVEVGEEKRQLIAGIAQHYSAEEVIGKTIVIVANLKPARIRGVESQGMLLCASVSEQLMLITVDGELPSSGADVK